MYMCIVYVSEACHMLAFPKTQTGPDASPTMCVCVCVCVWLSETSLVVVSLYNLVCPAMAWRSCIYLSYTEYQAVHANRILSLNARIQNSIHDSCCTR